MRVFVTGTGRCGTRTFAKACEHITNYTAGHETSARNLVYPNNHIEVSSHIQVSVWELIEKYPNAKWVHLHRNEADCVKSLAVVCEGEVINSWARLRSTVVPTNDNLEAARRATGRS